MDTLSDQHESCGVRSTGGGSGVDSLHLCNLGVILHITANTPPPSKSAKYELVLVVYIPINWGLQQNSAAYVLIIMACPAFSSRPAPCWWLAGSVSNLVSGIECWMGCCVCDRCAFAPCEPSNLSLRRTCFRGVFPAAWQRSPHTITHDSHISSPSTSSIEIRGDAEKETGQVSRTRCIPPFVRTLAVERT